MTVEHKRLGNHGTIVSNLCLGTVNFGTVTSEKESFAIMDRALELGINFFDTADVYGYGQRGSQATGIVEEILGRWFAQGGGRRESVVLATKVYSAFLKATSNRGPVTSSDSLHGSVGQVGRSIK